MPGTEAREMKEPRGAEANMEKNPEKTSKEEGRGGEVSYATPVPKSPPLFSTNQPPKTPVYSSSFQKSVCLDEWWLAKVERDCNGKRLAIGGLTSNRQHAVRVFLSSPISKRHDAFTLETEDGITVFIQGLINRSRTLQNGFPLEACNKFLTGFPFNWEVYIDQFLGKESFPQSASTSGSSSNVFSMKTANSASSNPRLCLDELPINKELDCLISTHGSSENDQLRRYIFIEILNNCSVDASRNTKLQKHRDVNGCPMMEASLPNETADKHEVSKGDNQSGGISEMNVSVQSLRNTNNVAPEESSKLSSISLSGDTAIDRIYHVTKSSTLQRGLGSSCLENTGADKHEVSKGDNKSGDISEVNVSVQSLRNTNNVAPQKSSIETADKHAVSKGDKKSGDISEVNVSVQSLRNTNNVAPQESSKLSSISLSGNTAIDKINHVTKSPTLQTGLGSSCLENSGASLVTVSMPIETLSKYSTRSHTRLKNLRNCQKENQITDHIVDDENILTSTSITCISQDDRSGYKLSATSGTLNESNLGSEVDKDLVVTGKDEPRCYTGIASKVTVQTGHDGSDSIDSSKQELHILKETPSEFEVGRLSPVVVGVPKETMSEYGARRTSTRLSALRSKKKENQTPSHTMSKESILPITSTNWISQDVESGYKLSATSNTLNASDCHSEATNDLAGADRDETGCCTKAAFKVTVQTGDDGKYSIDSCKRDLHVSKETPRKLEARRLSHGLMNSKNNLQGNQTAKRSVRTETNEIYQSVTTPNGTKKLSMDSPEFLNLKRSRSGRLLVPRLAPWHNQALIYDQDGKITGINLGFDEKASPADSKFKPTKKKKKLF